jgi:CHAT domain-containing protein
MTRIGEWTPTEILVPKGAMVGVIAEGTVSIWRGRERKTFPPAPFLKFRIGEGGPLRGLARFYNSASVNMVHTQTEGSFYYCIGPQFRDSRNKSAQIKATILVWQKQDMDRIEGDIGRFMAHHPENKAFQALLFPLASSFVQMGRYAKAEIPLKHLREADQSQGREAALALMISSRNEKGLRRFERAKSFAEGALEISTRQGFKGLQGEALLMISETLFHLKKQEEASRRAEEVLRLAAELRRGSKNLAGRAHMLLGFLSLQEGKLPDALGHAEKAVQNLSESRALKPLAHGSLLLGRVQRRLNMDDQAKRSLNDAIRIAAPFGRVETLWRAHAELGAIAEKEKDGERALKHYAEAIQIIEAMRGELEDPALKAYFMEDKFKVYERMIHLLQTLRRDGDAFHYLERVKARSLLDMLRDKAFSSSHKEVSALLVRERSLTEQIQQLAAEAGESSFQDITGESETDGDEPEPDGEKSLNLDPLRSELREVRARIEKLNPDLGSLLSVNPLTAKEVQALLDKDEALLAYFIGFDHSSVFVVTREKVLCRALARSRREIGDRVKAFRFQAVRDFSPDRFGSRDFEKPLGELYDTLLSPVDGEIKGKRHLVVVPHGILHYLPFQVLQSEGNRLIQSFTLSYLPSASVLKYARAKNRGNRAGILAVGNPVTDLSPLPSAEEEARNVSELFEKKVLLTGETATETSVKEEGTRHDLVLFATHGEMIESDPLESNLRFTRSDQDDGRLTVSEIFDIEVKASLVTLSACETGLARGTGGDFPMGDDLVGLSRAFIHAGAPSVVASLWKVSDDSTVILMHSFYRNLMTMPKAEALRKAQLDLTKSGPSIYAHPYYWAPFILVGDWK